MEPPAHDVSSLLTPPERGVPSIGYSEAARPGAPPTPLDRKKVRSEYSALLLRTPLHCDTEVGSA